MEWMDVIGSVGFPIGVTMFILIRLEGTLKENTKALKEMSIELAILRGNRKGMNENG